ncbi:MAG TPA: hypothetical protein VKZ77_14775 [Bacillaceae bacterium]|nr:hypothetical protein [Paenibacillus bovis]HLU23724.1 hypothetical protein [Bacillaceae bacterium]
MTRNDLLNKLESISSQIDNLEKMVAEKISLEENWMKSRMEHTDKQMNQKIVELESLYNSQKRLNQETQPIALAR